MGLREILTKPINIGSTAFRWTEPPLYRLRLRGDLWLRVLIVLGAWAGGTGIMLALFAINVDPPGLATALGLGLVLGGCPAAMLTMMLKDHAGGNVMVRQGEFHRNRWYASLSMFFFSWVEYGDWPYNVIRKCVIVPGSRINKSFSVMLLSVGPETVVVGIPRKIDLKKLAGFLSSKGVTVTPGESLPASLRKPLNLVVGLSIPALALLVFLAGSTFYLVRVGFRAAERDDFIARRDQFSDIPDLTVPPPTLSNLPLGNPEKPAGGREGSPMPDMTQTDISVPAPSFPEPEENFGFGGRRRTEPPARPPEAVSPGAGNRTATVGGTGGIPFETVDPDGREVIGVRFRMGEWGGAARVASLAPLFEPASPGRDESVQLARDGYALGALDVSGAGYVDAVRPVFMKVGTDGLDSTDSYEGDWIGTPGDSVTRLTGDGAKVTGFHGRGAAVLDAVGLVVKPE